jgi:ABC-type nitrate/sulfonate/bicarbonate transport system substrate-binding protein
MRRLRSLALVAAVVASVLAVLPPWPLAGATAAPAPSTAAAAQRIPLSVGFVSLNALAWAFYAAEALGSFEQEGLALDTSVLGSAPQVTTAVVSGSVDVGNAAMDVHIRAVERGADLVWFMTELGVPIYALLGRPNVGSYADLRGQTIIVDSPNGITSWLTRRMLATAGLGPDDYNYIYAGATSDRFAALTAGGVAAAILIQPFDFAAERQGYRRLGNSNDVVRSYEFVGYTTRRDWLNRNEDAAARLIRAYLAGQRWLYDTTNKERAIQVLSDKTRLSPEDARATYELYVERERPFPPGGRINPAGVQAVLDALVELGELTPPTPPPSKYVEPGYVERYGQ